MSVGISRKRKRGERIFKFETFCDHGDPTIFNGNFRDNVGALLEFGNSETNDRRGITKWSSFRLELQNNLPVDVRLFVVEESVAVSLYRCCQYCRSVGWGNHLISNKRFHFIVPSKEYTTTGVDVLNNIEACFCKNTHNNDKQTGSRGHHLLHGVVHSNGFGHLLTINGIEGGSQFLSGTQILHLWDRICTALKVRMVSLIDVARKGSMELRLINGLAYGEPWFGRFGYKFGHTSYGISHELYLNSLGTLQTLPLSLLIPHFSPEVSLVIAKYQNICGQAMQTLGDLFRVVVELKNRLPFNSTTSIDYRGIVGEAPCRWAPKRVEMAAQVIINELKKSESMWISRQEVRDAARAYIGDTGLLDYVLKSLGNQIVGSYIVRRVVNPVTKVLEYCLEDVFGSYPTQNMTYLTNPIRALGCNLTKAQLMKDSWCLYKHILSEQRPSPNSGLYTAIAKAVRVVLDSKHLVKDYNGNISPVFEQFSDVLMKIPCTVQIKDDLSKNLVRKKFPPYELITVPSHATVQDFKIAAERYYRDMYCGLRHFTAETVVFGGAIGADTDAVFELAVPETVVVIEGKVGEMEKGEIYEGGRNELIVDCNCGAKEEDGERTIVCDICDVMQHTRCVGILDGDEVPEIYLCSQCESDIFSFPSFID